MRNIVSLFASLSLVGIFAVTSGAVAHAQAFKAGSIVIEQPWMRATPVGAKVAAGYLTIENTGSEADRLVGGSMARSGRAEIHQMTMDKGVMQMREVGGGLEIKPGQKVKLEPDGSHLMFMGLSQPLKQDESVKGRLRFEKAGTVEIEYKVGAVGAKHLGQHGEGH